MANRKQIIALGDGGLDLKNPLLDLYILAQVSSDQPKVCFLPTASGDNFGLIRHFKATFERYPCQPSVLSLFSPSIEDIRGHLLDQEIIYVGGGHTKSMLGVWREWGVDAILREAYEKGIILAGGSAGSVCWFEECITDSYAGELRVMSCLGLLPGSNCPHFTSPFRQVAYKRFLAGDEIKAGYANDDGAALHFVDGQLMRSVSADPTSRTHSAMVDGITALPTTFLGTEENQQQFIWSSQPFQAYLAARATKEQPKCDVCGDDCDTVPEETDDVRICSDCAVFDRE